MSESESPDVDESDEQEPTGADAEPEAVEEAAEVLDGVGGGGGGMDLGGFISSGGIREALMQDSFRNEEENHEFSQADLFADIVNIMRMDTKQLCAIHGYDVEMERMSPERAAELLEEMALNNGAGLIEVFEDIEDKKELILSEEFSDEEYEKYQKFKLDFMYSTTATEAPTDE